MYLNGVKVYCIDEPYSILEEYEDLSNKQYLFDKSRTEMCERMRSPNLPPLQNNEIEFSATCMVCWKVHPFRVTIQQFPDKIIQDKDMEHNKIDFFTPQERADAVNNINIQHRKSRASKSPWFDL